MQHQPVFKLHPVRLPVEPPLCNDSPSDIPRDIPERDPPRTYVRMHVRTYVLCENRSSIQSLALMRSATNKHFTFGVHPECANICCSVGYCM